jgi:hypothetical protein
MDKLGELHIDKLIVAQLANYLTLCLLHSREVKKFSAFSLSAFRPHVFVLQALAMLC